jgi:hypothetical protein
LKAPSALTAIEVWEKAGSAAIERIVVAGKADARMRRFIIEILPY